ncbi:MAG: type II secretion system minor pseudopilin GspJ [Marinobacter sp.]|uniref:type II secretion system minor pseudopilin GspJ n=1 Tax=Marinobacter sp. TaxID=50741 RepID=UPI001B6B473D|nr:type II secretion system minor pseudopilin GspJ [Marinobacter sp.]MBQ0747270.1 type II secretion system minor pseudopilin GspJ [Marinobacter sp.]MBQ0815700.1 type II secretion system minor pseudopilin GspJ [Marinobacter sp.]|tara:strand:+ start:2774 stop:3526 length:753 start_codon:yes stop_codon:yes gene_type:complete
MRELNCRRGFTLLEVLVAITITAVIGIGVWQVLNGVILSRDRVDELAEQFDGLQRAMLLLERDITQIVNRPARDIYGDFKPALTSREDDFALMVTRQGWRNPLGIRRSSLQRVGWEYTGSELRRRYWPTVDQGQEDNGRDQLLLGDVTAFDLRFLNEQNSWETEWPPDDAMAALTPGTRPDIPFPRGIEITVEHELFGELVRTFVLPDYDPAGAQGLVNQINEARSEADEEQGASATEQGATQAPTGQGG